MTDQEAADYAADVKTLQQALGRLPQKATPMKYMMLIGQSLAAGATGTPALSTTQLYSNKTFIGGSISPLSTLQSGL